MTDYSPSTAFLRRLGALSFVESITAGDTSHESTSQAPLTWKKLPRSDEKHAKVDVQLPEDYDQPKPLTLQIVFQPDADDVYDIQWVIEASQQLQTDDHIIRAYRISDGSLFVQKALFPITIVEPLVTRNRKVVRGDALVRCVIPSLVLDLAHIRQEFRLMQMDLAQAVNAAFKGYMGCLGQSGQIVKRAVPVHTQLRPEEGYEHLREQIVDAVVHATVEEGDVVIVSEKVIAIAQKRLFPLDLLYQLDPKTMDREGRFDLLVQAQRYISDLTVDDLLCSDSLLDWPDVPMATGGVADPNTVAADIAKAIREKTTVRCDVVISDTDTGLDVRETLINCITIGATPLGATAGLVIYDCMRAANAAEFCRGSTRGIPIVICKPHVRRIRREGIGEFRGYQGRLDALKERLIGYA